MAIEHNNPVPENPGLPDEDCEGLLDDYSHFAPPAEGEILPGRVLVTPKDVIVDFGYVEGLVPPNSSTMPPATLRCTPAMSSMSWSITASVPKDMCCCRMSRPRGCACGQPGSSFQRSAHHLRTCWPG